MLLTMKAFGGKKDVERGNPERIYTVLTSYKNQWSEVAMYRKGEVPAARRSQVRVLCIDNHASLNYVCLLLARSGYMVNRAGFLCDALDLIHRSSYDLYVVNDKLACGPGEDPFKSVRKAAGTTPIVFYKTCRVPVRSAFGGPMWQHARDARPSDGSTGCGWSRIAHISTTDNFNTRSLNKEP